MVFKKELTKASEKALERKLKTAVDLVMGLCLKLIPVSFRGFPDRTVLLPKGRIIFVEVKSEGYDQNTPTVRRQCTVRALLEQMGFKYYLIDTEAALREFIIAEL